MNLIYLTLAIIIFLYLCYPIWLMLNTPDHDVGVADMKEIDSISVILLSYNGEHYLLNKINFLLNELRAFKNQELIIIDDGSTDGSVQLINKFRNNDKVRIILKKAGKGIPHSMNRGVEMARYEHVVFSDQRQTLSPNILCQIVEPLKDHHIGAVSACLSPINKQMDHSFLREHENYLKIKESKLGNLMGVYGPCYAINKSCYPGIPEHIILDDLYLSLRVLPSKKIVLLKGCEIFDESISHLYDYQRTKRYLKGLLQILKEPSLISQLSTKQIIMLLWHKYLRLSIPAFLFLSYVLTGLKALHHQGFLMAFSILSLIGAAAFLPLKIDFRMKNFIRINILYFVALFDIVVHQITHHVLIKPKIN